MWKDNLVFYKVRVILFFVHILAFTKKPSSLSTNLYDQVYFDRRDQFNPSMSSSDT